MWAALKQRIKRRLQGHFRHEMTLAALDIELARRHKAAVEAAAIVDQFMPMAVGYSDRQSLLRAAIAQIKVEGLCCEFGVYQGESINFIASLRSGEVHGFDSFEGLPEDWRTGHEKGTFALAGLPQVRTNVRLHRGRFESTIAPFKQEYSEPIAFLHLDADLYSSTRTVLDLLGDRIVAGTVLQFDEFFNYPGWQAGEYKAFTEFCATHNAEVRYLGYVRCGSQVAMKIVSIGR
jgi:Macrocin-O-methyltransferase (TylF)